MNLDPQTRTRIDEMLAANPIVLFMKGDRSGPRCGFSAQAIGALESLGTEYTTVDVLADEDIRQGIKEYGNWPTIPQLYVRGELLGGSDIVAQMLGSGELHSLLGLDPPDRTPPLITITEAAARAIRPAIDGAEGAVLHLAIDAAFQPNFELALPGPNDVVAESSGIEVHFDTASAPRARGLVIDWADSVAGGGLALRNPNAPQPVRGISAADAAAALHAGTLILVDVRPSEERALAALPGPVQTLEGDGLDRVEALPKDSALAFLCHHGTRSREAATHFRDLGFSNAVNIEGGIDAWSREVDESIPRY